MKGVPSAGWRIRKIPDCASSAKTHLSQGHRLRLAVWRLLGEWRLIDVKSIS